MAQFKIANLVEKICSLEFFLRPEHPSFKAKEPANDWQQIELDVGGGGKHVGERWTAAALSSLVCRQAERV